MFFGEQIAQSPLISAIGVKTLYLAASTKVACQVDYYANQVVENDEQDGNNRRRIGNPPDDFLGLSFELTFLAKVHLVAVAVGARIASASSANAV